MAGIPYRSRLEPFYELIVQSRRDGMTWEEIASDIRSKNVPVTRQAVQDYFKRRRAKKPRVPMGMEPPPVAAVRRSTPVQLEPDPDIVDEAREAFRKQQKTHQTAPVQNKPGTEL